MFQYQQASDSNNNISNDSPLLPSTQHEQQQHQHHMHFLHHTTSIDALTSTAPPNNVRNITSSIATTDGLTADATLFLHHQQHSLLLHEHQRSFISASVHSDPTVAVPGAPEHPIPLHATTPVAIVSMLTVASPSSLHSSSNGNLPPPPLPPQSESFMTPSASTTTGTLHSSSSGSGSGVLPLPQNHNNHYEQRRQGRHEYTQLPVHYDGAASSMSSPPLQFDDVFPVNNFMILNSDTSPLSISPQDTRTTEVEQLPAGPSPAVAEGDAEDEEDLWAPRTPTPPPSLVVVGTATATIMETFSIDDGHHATSFSNGRGDFPLPTRPVNNSSSAAALQARSPLGSQLVVLVRVAASPHQQGGGGDQGDSSADISTDTMVDMPDDEEVGAPTTATTTAGGGVSYGAGSSSRRRTTNIQYRLQLNNLPQATCVDPQHLAALLDYAKELALDTYRKDLWQYQQQQQAQAAQTVIAATPEQRELMLPAVLLVDSQHQQNHTPTRVSNLSITSNHSASVPPVPAGQQGPPLRRRRSSSSAASVAKPLSLWSTPTIPSSFADVPVVEITFNHNKIGLDALPLLWSFIEMNTFVRSFEMLGNQLADDAGPALEELVKRCPHLQRLKLADNRLGDGAGLALGNAIFAASSSTAAAVPPAPTTAISTTTTTGVPTFAPSATIPSPFRTRPRFLQLNVGGNKIGDVGVRAICEAALASGLQILGLRGVAMSPLGWAFCGSLCAAYHITADLLAPSPTPRQLNTATPILEGRVSTSPLSQGSAATHARSSATSSVGTTTATASRSSHAITELQLKFNSMDDACMESFVRSALLPSSGGASLRTSTITSLSLACCTITSAMCERLVPLLMQNLLMLQHLDISHNPAVGDLGVEALATWLKTPHPAAKLSSLAIDSCGLTVAGLARFANAIRHATTSSNGAAPLGLRRSGSSALPATTHPSSEVLGAPPLPQRLTPPQAEPVGAYSSLRVLNLGGNIFGVHATPMVVDLLSHFPGIEKLHLRGCHLGGPYLEGFVQKILHWLPNLSDVDFTSNFSGDHGVHWGTLMANSPTIRRLLLTDNHITNPAVPQAFSTALLKSPHRQLVVFQVGGKSKTEPLGNVIAPAAHTVILKAIQRNRQHNSNSSTSGAAAAPPAPAPGPSVLNTAAHQSGSLRSPTTSVAGLSSARSSGGSAQSQAQPRQSFIFIAATPAAAAASQQGGSAPATHNVLQQHVTSEDGAISISSAQLTSAAHHQPFGATTINHMNHQLNHYGQWQLPPHQSTPSLPYHQPLPSFHQMQQRPTAIRLPSPQPAFPHDTTATTGLSASQSQQHLLSPQGFSGAHHQQQHVLTSSLVSPQGLPPLANSSVVTFATVDSQQQQLQQESSFTTSRRPRRLSQLSASMQSSVSLMPSPSAAGVLQQSLQHHLHQLAQNSAHTIQPHYAPSSHNVGGAGPSQSSSLSAPPAFLLPQPKLQQMQPFSAAAGIIQSTSSFAGDHLSHFSFGSAGGMSLSSSAVPQQHPVGAVVGSNGPLVSGTTLSSLITSAGSNGNNSSMQAAANPNQLFQGQSSSALPVSPLNYSPLEALKSSATLLTPTATSTGTAAAQQQPSQQPFVTLHQQFLVHHHQHQQPQDEQPQINHHLTVPQQSLHPQLHHQQHAAMMMPSQPNQFIAPGPHLGGSSSENLQHQIPPHQIVWGSAPTQFQQQQQQHHVLHYQTPS